MRAATVALVIRRQNGEQDLIETLSDDREIEVFEAAMSGGVVDPLERVYAHRIRQQKEDGEFGDYVEDLLSHPFQKFEIKEHGMQWLKSKLRIDAYQKKENEAARIIAQYAYDVFTQEPDKTDFFLAGPTAQVRVRVFVLDGAALRTQAA